MSIISLVKVKVPKADNGLKDPDMSYFSKPKC